VLRSRVAGLGHFVPARVMTNAELERLVDTSDQWIRDRSGIEERHIAAPDETASTLALKAARRQAVSPKRPPPPSAAVVRHMALRCPRDLAGLRDRALLLLVALGLSRRDVVGLQAERLRCEKARFTGAS